MHLLLTDRLTCPRCGPAFGLILRADLMDGRQVVEGVLGCPNCRDQFPVHGGFGDLRAPPRRDPGPGLAGLPDPRPEDAEEADRLHALLGVAQGPGTLGLVGSPARHAEALAARIEGIHVMAVDADLGDRPESPGVSRLLAGPGLPVYDRTLRGVAVDARLGAGWIGEAARAVARLGRVVVVRAGPDARGLLEAAGLEVLAAAEDVVVAARR